MAFKCPFCSALIPESSMRSNIICYDDITGINTRNRRTAAPPLKADPTYLYDPCSVKLVFYHCDECQKNTIYVEGVGELEELKIPINPRYVCTHFPDYVPQAIRADYEEACAIKSLSPKASATLARRCLQGMIRDFWEVKPGKLNYEINQLKGQVQPDLWDVIDSVRSIGNIGAHMEHDVNIIVDIDPDEADRLIKLIELLIKEWYIANYQRQELFASITELNSRTKADRKQEKL